MSQKNDSEKPNIAEYLSSPKRKRKNFVVLAFGANLRSDIPTAVSGFLRAQFRDIALVHPKSPEDLQRHFSKQIVLVVYDDEFTALHPGLEILKSLKEKKDGVVPFLFLTRRPEDLVQAYNEVLLPYHEADEYISYAKTPVAQILSKVKSGLVNRNRRKSRRYSVDLPITFWRLSSEDRTAGRLMDLSVHGALMQASDDQLFRSGDQVKISLPVGNYLDPVEGDYLRLSARVRRVFISGTTAGISFEHMSDRQRFLLAQFLTGYVNSQVTRQGRVYRSKKQG